MFSWPVIFGIRIIELICCNPVGRPVRLWTTGTVGWQCVLSVYCVQLVSVMSSLSLSLQGEISTSSDECAWEYDFNIWSVMFRSVSIRFVVVLNAVQHNWPHSKPNTVMNLQVQFKCLALPDLSHVVAPSGNRLNCWVADRQTDISMKLPFPKIIKKSIQKNEGQLILVAYCTHQCNKCLYAFLSSPTDCI